MDIGTTKAVPASSVRKLPVGSRNRLDCSHYRHLMDDDPQSARHRRTIRGVVIVSRPDSEPEAASELRANGQLQRSRRSR